MYLSDVLHHRCGVVRAATTTSTTSVTSVMQRLVVGRRAVGGVDLADGVAATEFAGPPLGPPARRLDPRNRLGSRHCDSSRGLRCLQPWNNNTNNVHM